MKLDFNKVGYDGELSDFSEDELRELVREFETAQDSNVAEFETAVEATDGLDESTISDFEQAREDLVEEIVDSEEFEQVPLSEDKLGEESFAELQDWSDFVADLAEEEDVEDDESSTDFGTRSPKPDEEDEGADFAEEALSEMNGLTL
jgi:hypothetical protein